MTNHKIDLSKVAIHINSLAEKIATLCFFEKFSNGKMLDKIIPNALLDDFNWQVYNYIIIDGNDIYGSQGDIVRQLKTLTVIEFADIPKLFKANTVSVKLNDEYDAIVSADEIKVGCRTFPISIIDKLVEAKEKTH